MTYQCKFGMGNSLFVPLAGNTCTPVMVCVKLFYPQRRRPQRKRTDISTVRLNWEGRTCPVWVKAAMEGESSRLFSSASPVSCRWHALKAICAKSGDLAASKNMLRERLSRVAYSITFGERDSDGLQGVGGVRSTDDMKDSITFKEERHPAACMPVLSRGGLHSSLETERGTRI